MLANFRGYRRLIRLLIGLGSLGLAAPAFASVDLPFSVEFEAAEGFSVGLLPVTQTVWTYPATLEVQVFQPGAVEQQGLLIQGKGFLDFAPTFTSASSVYPITWVDFYTTPIFNSVTALPSAVTGNQAALVGFAKDGVNGRLYLGTKNSSGAIAWSPSTFFVNLGSAERSDWLRISYRLNYAAQRWDLFVNSELVARDQVFANPVSAFTRFGLRGDTGISTRLDSFYVGSENPLYDDTTGGGIPDAWLIAHGLSTTLTRDADPDNDGAGLWAEYVRGLSPTRADSDNDGINDGLEISLGFAPSSPDSDADGVYDGRELLWSKNPLIADAYVLGAIPFTENFESDAVGAFADGFRLWKVTSTAFSGVNVSSVDPLAEGSKWLELTGEYTTIERYFTDSTHGTVWIDFRLRAVPRLVAPSTPRADVSAYFYLDTNNRLMVLDGNGHGGGEWRSVAAVSSDWRRLTLRMDYANQQWSLWLDGVRYAESLGFAWHVPFLSGFALQTGGDVAGLDDLSVSRVEPVQLDNDGDGLSNEAERLLGTNPELKDTDGDGIWDGVENTLGLNPLLAESFIARLQPEANGVYAWRTSFATTEGYTAGSLHTQLGWTAANAVVTTSENAKLSASSGSVSNIEHYIGANGLDRVWVSFRARLKAGLLPASGSFSGDAVGVFGFSNERTLAVYDSGLGQWVERAVSVYASDWNNYAFFLDYKTKRWTLVINGVIAVADVPFRNNAASTITRLAVLQSSSADAVDHDMFIDDLVVSNTEPQGYDFDNDGLSNEQERLLGTDPLNPDSDGDGMTDGWEVANGLNPKLADNLADLDGDGFSNGVEFKYGMNPAVADAAKPGFAHWDEWTNIAGDQVNRFTLNARFPSSPNTRDLLPSLELPADRGIGYGTRLRAWLVAPASGDYTFWIAGNNGAELWLSTDSMPFARKLIARNLGVTDVREWELRPAAQRSIPITLQAGQRYYIEVLHKQGAAEGHLSVAWQIPGSTRAVVSGAYLEAFPLLPNDQNEDGLPDTWAAEHGITTSLSAAGRGSYGDADGDRLINLLEYQRGLDPLVPDTDGDGFNDYLETLGDANPLVASDLNLTPWQFGNVGNVTGAAFANCPLPDTYQVAGTGYGVYLHRSDSVRYLYRQVSGDFEFVTRIVRPSSSPLGYGGIAVRGGLDAQAISMTLLLDSNGRHRLFYRTAATGDVSELTDFTPSHASAAASLVGYWAKVRREGNLVRFFYSVDGQNWLLAGAKTLPLSDSCYLGMVVCHEIGTDPGDDTTEPAVRRFENVQLTTGATAPAPSANVPEDASASYLETISGNAGVTVKGEWSTIGDSLVSQTFTGTLDYTFTVAADGLYRLTFAASSPANPSANTLYPLALSVDGELVARIDLVLPNGEVGLAQIVTPWLKAGTHTVRLLYDNTLSGRSLSVRSLMVEILGGTDNNDNGRADWIDERLAALNTLGVTDTEFFVSPVSLDGKARYRSLFALTADNQPVTVNPAPGFGWYANVPLSPTAPVALSGDFENTASLQSALLVWKPLNLLAVPADLFPDGKIRIRKGDSLRFTAAPAEGAVGDEGSAILTISRSGLTPLELTVDQPGTGAIVQAFATAGVYSVTGVYTGADGIASPSAVFTVEVVEAAFAADPVVGLNNVPVTWNNPLITDDILVEVDQGLSLVKTATLSGGGTRFGVSSTNTTDSYVLARLGASGPVFGHATVHSVGVATVENTSVDTISVYPDGSQLIGVPLIVSGLTDNTKVVVEIFVQGVTFEDGTTTKTFTKADFDQYGRIQMRFIYPAGLTTSICHRVKLYEGATSLGGF